MSNLRCVRVEGLAWAMLIAYHRGKLDRDDSPKLFDEIAGIAEGQDVIIGTIADDQIYTVLPEFFSNAITDQVLLACLRGFGLGTQYVLKSSKACGHVTILTEKSFTDQELKALRDEREKNRDEKTARTDAIKERYLRQGDYFTEIKKRLERGLQDEPDHVPGAHV